MQPSLLRPLLLLLPLGEALPASAWTEALAPERIASPFVELLLRAPAGKMTGVAVSLLLLSFAGMAKTMLAWASMLTWWEEVADGGGGDGMSGRRFLPLFLKYCCVAFSKVKILFFSLAFFHLLKIKKERKEKEEKKKEDTQQASTSHVRTSSHLYQMIPSSPRYKKERIIINHY